MSTDADSRRGADTLAAEKAALRASARDARAALGAEQCAADSAAIAERVLALPELADARVVLAYGATPEEVDVAGVAAALRARGVRVAYPRVDAPGELTLHAVADESELVAGAFGLREPAADAPTVEAAEIDAVLVPGVAFDERGGRLGYGGGFYDRLLVRLSAHCVRIGVAFEEQMVAAIPREEHDAGLDWVVTPGRAVRITQGAE